MRRVSIRELLAGLVAVAVVLTSCTPAPPPPPTDGLVSPQVWQQRQRAYLAHATSGFDPAKPDSVLAQLMRRENDSLFVFSPRQVNLAALRPVLDKIDRHADTSDFDLMRVWLLVHRYGDRFDPELTAALRTRLLTFRYWYTDPQPPANRVDNKWFWTENHRIIIHTLEYLAGTQLPDERFEVSGETGRVHAERGRVRINAWLDDKTRWGFSEWHSDVYYAEDIQALLLLTEYAEPAIAARATTMLDAMFLDLGVHQLRGNMGVTHGRSYMKDKSRASDQDVSNVIEFLYGGVNGATTGYRPGADFGALLLATTTRYRLPVALQRIAADPAAIVDREQMSVPLDPAAPVRPNPVPPPGTTFAGDEAVEFWWDRGALTTWQLAPASIAAINRYRLDRGEMFKPLRGVLIGDQEVAATQNLMQAVHCQLNTGLLSQVDTVTYRNADVMLSSAQDFRPGCLGHQYHPWQATLGPDAVVFTTHPLNADTGTWADSDFYWNGGVLPRTAQQGSVAINVYAPRFDPGPDDAANYLNLTHAFFPVQHFDQVRQHGRWLFARKGDGYVALYSWRDAEWAPVGPNPAGLTKAYDLVAEGGPDNVWITEVGDAARWGSFDAFVEAVRGARVEVTEEGTAADRRLEVAYASPGEGALSFGSTGPLLAAGAIVDLHPGVRMDNPYTRVARGQPRWQISAGGAHLEIDLATGVRSARA